MSGGMTAAQQGVLLDRLSAGQCVYAGCGGGGLVAQSHVYVVNSVSLPVALWYGPSRVVRLDVLVCRVHAGRR